MKQYQITILTFVIIILQVLQANAQTEFNGKTYYPMPLPVVDSVSKVILEEDKKATRYSFGTQETLALPKDNSNLKSENSVNGFSPSSTLFDETSGMPESFSSLEYVANTVNYPQRTTVKLFMHNNGSYGVCSGALIGPNLVLTAAHCIYDWDNNGGWAEEVRVVPGYDNGYEPLGFAYAIDAVVWNGWLYNEDANWDVAILELDWNIGNDAGWLGYGYENNINFYQSNTFHNYSYPAAQPYNGEFLFYRNGQFDDAQNNVLYHFPQAYGGQSGSPYYLKEGNDRYAMGVLSHTTGSGATGVIRLNDVMFNVIQDLSGFNNPTSNKLVVAPKLEAKIFPNPVADRLNIELDIADVSDISISIFNTMGQLVYESEWTSAVDVSSFPVGMYQLSLKGKTEMITKKFIVRR